MATLRDIRRRIASVKSTQQITRAMKMVAAAKLRRSQERLMNARPYAEQIDKILSHVASDVDRSHHRLLAEREPNNICYVVVSSDKGLCGSFNANVLRVINTEIKDLDGSQAYRLLTIGKKAHEHFSRRGYELIDHHEEIFDNLQLKRVSLIADAVVKLYESGNIDRVYLVYNEFRSIASQAPVARQVLPIEAKPPDLERFEPADYIFEPSLEDILDAICKRYLAVQLWRALLESNAAEQAARMVAMEAATDNAQEMIHDLTLHYNKARQAAITREIADIVGGAEALRS